MRSNKTKKGAIVIEGHVQGLALTRSLGEKGIPVYVVDKRNCVARYSKYAQKFFICPDFNADAFVDFLIKLAKKENISGWVLLPSNDHAVITLSRNKQRLGVYYKMLVPEFDKIEQIYNKVTLLSTASGLGIPIPSTFCFTNTGVDGFSMSFPVITKGKHGLTFYRALKNKAFIANAKEDLEKQLKDIQGKINLADTFTQSVIRSDGTNKTISFTAFCESGTIKTFWMGVKLREHPLQFGTATLTESILEPRLIEPSKRLIKHFRYSGVCEIEFLKDPLDSQFKLIEINARTWLWVGLAKACGVDYGLYIYNHLNGLTNEFPKDYKLGVKWINRLTDTVYSISAISKGLLTIANYFKSMKGNRVGALYYQGDLKPLFAYALMTFSFLRRR
jgi:D-aspartate ligase